MSGEPELYAWMVLEADGRWGVISGVMPMLGPVPLVTGSPRAARALRKIAEQHRETTGKPVRLFRFSQPAVKEELP